MYLQFNILKESVSRGSVLNKYVEFRVINIVRPLNKV